MTPTRNPAFVALAQRLTAMRRRDLLLPVANAIAALRLLALLIERAADDAAARRRLKIESMRARAAAERALFRVVEAIGEDEHELVAGILGEDERSLADKLLDD